jgi:hypothetical protein
MIDMDSTGRERLHQVITWLSCRGGAVALTRANQRNSALRRIVIFWNCFGGNGLWESVLEMPFMEQSLQLRSGARSSTAGVDFDIAEKMGLLLQFRDLV